MKSPARKPGFLLSIFIIGVGWKKSATNAAPCSSNGYLEGGDDEQTADDGDQILR